ncbi:MAG TPA: hypothetical protein VI011_16400 [Asanoa sp.]
MTAVSHVDSRTHAQAWSVVAAVAGVAGSVLVILFFRFGDAWGWPGPASDAAVAVQFAALAPVVRAVRRDLPDTRGVRIATVTAFVACLVVAVLQALLAGGVLTFEAEIGPAVVAFLVVYAWLVVASLAAHRARSLPRPVTRAGLLVGVVFLVGLVFAGAGFLLPDPVGTALSYIGYAVSGIGWLAFAFFPLLLASHVFTKEEP